MFKIELRFANFKLSKTIAPVFREKTALAFKMYKGINANEIHIVARNSKALCILHILPIFFIIVFFSIS